MPSMKVGEVDLAYELYDFTEPWRSGRAPVLFLHGLGGDRITWLYQAREFCREFPVVTVDLRGHGASSRVGGDFTIAEMARDVARLLRQLGVERVHTVGLSMGGMVAQQLALDHPHAVASLVLVDTACGIPAELDEAAKAALQFIEDNTMATVAATRITAAFSDAVDDTIRKYFIDRVARNDKTSYERAARATYAFDVRNRLGEIAVPALVVVGMQDRTLPPPLSEELAQRIRGARLVRIEGGAHLSNIERPDEFNRAVLEFLRGAS